MQRFPHFIVIFVCLFLPLLAENPTTEELSTINTVTQILKAKEPWPGYQISSTPTIITFKNGHVFALGLNSPNSHWKTLSEGVQFSDHDEWGATSTPMQANFIIENKKSFVFQLDHSVDDTIEKPFMVLVHERFHQFQFGAFALMKGRSSSGYRDHMNAENLVLMQIEEKLLLDYLKIGSKEILRDFVAVNQTRRQMIDMQSSQHEIEQQMMEGLADYVSIKIFDETPIFKGFDGKQQLINTLEKYASHPDITQRAMKWRHYGVGATLGYVLDDLNIPDWKEKVQRYSQSQEEQLEIALPMTDQEIATRVEQVKSAYNYEDLKVRTTSIINAYKRFLDDVMRDYTDQPGVEVSVGRIRSTGQSGGGFSKRLIYMANGTVLALEDDSFASSSDQAWHLRLDKVPFALKGKGGEITFKVEEELSLFIDGQTYKAKELAQISTQKRFNSISWKGQKTAFGCEMRSGKLWTDNGCIRIEFD